MPTPELTQLSQDLVNNPEQFDNEQVRNQFSVAPDPTKEVGVISSQRGAELVTKAQENQERLTPLPTEEIPEREELPGAEQPEQEQDEITFINPETDATQVLRGHAITRNAIANLERQGFAQAESNLSEPIETSPEIISLQNQYEQAQKQTESFLKGLEDSLISDSELRSELRAIENLYNERIEEAERITDRGVAATRTLGLRTGSRYTGGTGGIIGGIIDERELQGLRTVTALEAEKQAALANARRAARQENFATYTTLINEAQQIQEKKFEALTELQEAAREQNERIAEERSKLETQGGIIDQIDLGFSDPFSIFSALNGEISFDDILEVTKNLPTPAETEQFTLGSMDIRYDGEGNVIARGSKVGGGAGIVSGIGVGVGNGVTTADFPSIADLETMTVEERNFVNAVLRQLPTKLKDSEQEKKDRQREALFDFRRGRGIQDVIDEMNGFVIENKTNQPIGNVFRLFATGTDLGLGQLSAAINRGDEQKAMTIVENANLEKVNAFFAPTDTARTTVKQAETVLKLLDRVPSEKLGAFDALEFKFDRIANLTDEEDIKLQQLETALQILNAPIRVEIVGTAATEAEMNKITAFQAAISSQPDIIETQVSELRDSVLRFHNQARSQRGLPEVNTTQLTNNSERIKIYEDIAAEQAQTAYSSLNNESLVLDILGEPAEIDSEFLLDNDFWNSL